MSKDFIKKQTPSFYLYAVGFVLTLLAFIFALVNNGAAGYFQGMTSGTVIVFFILALLAICGIVVLRQFEFKGIVGKIVEIVDDVLAIGVPVLLMAAFLLFLSPRIEGFAYILGSNADVKAEVQTASNMASLKTSIITLVIDLIAQIITVVAAFFAAKKAVAPAAADKVNA